MFLIKKDFWQVKTTKNKGKGIFAKKTITSGTVIGDYLGKVIKISEYDLEKDKKGLYLMFLNDEAAIYPDLKKPGIHLFNHSCEPNCWIYNYQGHTLFFTLRNIEVGEELTISYLLPPKSKNENPCTHICKCGSKICTGTMHLSEKNYQKWQKFQDDQKKKTKVEKFIFGKNLPKLASYPKTVILDLM
ncbi:MAG TPA: SET domain-containing protein [Patescibacteria group bacterium]|nr:SET domain-containing protein [Patescibacteria group bacterium]